MMDRGTCGVSRGILLLAGEPSSLLEGLLHGGGWRRRSGGAAAASLSAGDDDAVSIGQLG